MIRMNENTMQIQEYANHIKEEMIGRRYRHFKGGIYVVIDIAVHSETEDVLVVYKSFDVLNYTWCRPLSMFLSEVDHKKYPDVKQTTRFERIDDYD